MTSKVFADKVCVVTGGASGLGREMAGSSPQRDTVVLADNDEASLARMVAKALVPVKFVPVEQAARQVLAGVARKKMVIAFSGYVRQLAFLHRFLPGLFARFTTKQVEQFRTIRRAG